MNNKNELTEILIALNFDRNDQETISNYAFRNKKKIMFLSVTAYENEFPNFELCSKSAFMRLVVICVKLIDLKKQFEKKGIPLQVFINTIQDVTLRSQIYFEKTNNLGLTKDDVIWFRHLFGMQIFKLHSLQFQLREMIYLDQELLGKRYMIFDSTLKEQLAPGAPILNVHVQERADLSIKAIERSFTEAKQFFACYFPNYSYQAFLCYSWLLYPPMINEMNDSSNIKKFASYFDIVGQVADREDAMVRLFGKKKRPKTVLSQMSSLQKMAFEQPEIFGVGCGIKKC